MSPNTTPTALSVNPTNPDVKTRCLLALGVIAIQCLSDMGTIDCARLNPRCDPSRSHDNLDLRLPRHEVERAGNGLPSSVTAKHQVFQTLAGHETKVSAESRRPPTVSA